MPHLSIYYILYQNRNSRLMQMPEAATGGVLRKKDVLKNFAKLTEKQLCQSLFFNKVTGLRKLFLQNNFEQLLLKCGHCKNEVREIYCLCCREVKIMLFLRLKTQGMGEVYHHPALMVIFPTISRRYQP